MCMEDNIAIVSRTYDCGRAGDFAGFTADFAEDVRWTEMEGSPYSGTYVGAESIVAHVFEPIGREWAPFACEPQEFFASGDRVFMVGRYFGRHRASEKPFDVRVVHLWQLEDGKITAFEQFTDTRLIAEAMR